MVFRVIGIAISVWFWVIAAMSITKWSSLDGFVRGDKWMAWAMLIMVVTGDILRLVDSALGEKIDYPTDKLGL